MTDFALAAADRGAHWSALDDDVFDIVVIGAGITGSGVARDAAGRGFRVALIDSGDIGGGTSSRSSRLIHGGLRYLETFEFPLVFEALRERRRLLELAPHLVRPLAFLFPVYRGDETGMLKLTAGMWLYDILSLFRSPATHKMLSRRQVTEDEPRLRANELAGGAVYYDAQVDDARLTLAVAQAARDAGATVLTRASVVSIHPARQDVGALEVEDALTGAKKTLRARLIVNATGPWSDRVRQLADPDAAGRLRATKGVHIVVDRSRLGNQNAIIFRSPVDNRVMFVLPWRDYAYVGTTDTEYVGDPADVAADASDIEYLLESANFIFPSAKLEKSDVLSTWAGVRPLLAPRSGKGVTESETSREHEIWRDDTGLLNIAGGKLTTYRSMAAETVDVARQILKDEFGRRGGEFYTEFLPLPGFSDDEEGDLARIGRRLEKLGIDAEFLRPLWRRYGTDLNALLDLVEASDSLRQPIVKGRPYLRGEVVWAVRNELALQLEDVMRRRLQLFYDEVDGGLSVAEDVAGLMAGEEGIAWDEAAVAREVEEYSELVARSRPAPDLG